MRDADKDDDPLPWVSHAERVSHERGRVVADHRHEEGQLSIVLHGTMKIRCDTGWWLASAGRGIWIPPATDHAASYSEASAFVLLKILPQDGGGLPCGSQTIAVSGLLRELALEICRAREPSYRRLLADLVVHQVRRSTAAPVWFLPAGHDPRLVRLMERLRSHPELDLALEDLALWAGSSRRTMARLFLAETGMTFGRWRDHLRIMTALDWLARGATITRVALDLGYQSQSSFTTMFTRIIGTPPARFLREMLAPDDTSQPGPGAGSWDVPRPEGL